MITCSIPAATASSTAYWMTGLSTSGSISFGCAFVAGRKRVPQPAAGKTALRTRIEPRVRAGWIGRPSIPSGLGRAGSACRDGPGESADGLGERLGLVEVREVGRSSDQDAPRVRGDVRERALGRAKEEVHLAVQDE